MEKTTNNKRTHTAFADAFARCGNKKVYIVDRSEGKLIYLSLGLADMLGKSQSGQCDYDIRDLLKYIPYEEQVWLTSMLHECKALVDSINLHADKVYTISCDFHVTDGRNRFLLRHKFTPLTINRTTSRRMLLCVASATTGKAAGQLTLHIEDDQSYYVRDTDDHEWTKIDVAGLSLMEKTVLHMSIQGYNVNEIANKILRTQATVKWYRQAITRKMHVRDMEEAIYFVISHGIMLEELDLS